MTKVCIFSRRFNINGLHPQFLIFIGRFNDYRAQTVTIVFFRPQPADYALGHITFHIHRLVFLHMRPLVAHIGADPGVLVKIVRRVFTAMIDQ